MWPWPNKRSKVTWWPDINNCTLFGFLDPENHILDTLITSVALIHPEIMLIDHLGHVTLTNYGFQGHVMVRHYWFYIIWIPWPEKPYFRHWDHLFIIYRTWDNRTYMCWRPSWTPSWILDSGYRWETITSNFWKLHVNTKKMRPVSSFNH